MLLEPDGEETTDPVRWKTVLIGGEVTVLAAFAGVGIHLALQPARSPVPPPPLLLPAHGPVAPLVSPSIRPRDSVPAPTARAGEPAPPDGLAKLGREDQRQLNREWEAVRRLIRAVEVYLGERVIPNMQGRR